MLPSSDGPEIVGGTVRPGEEGSWVSLLNDRGRPACPSPRRPLFPTLPCLDPVMDCEEGSLRIRMLGWRHSSGSLAKSVVVLDLTGLPEGLVVSSIVVPDVCMVVYLYGLEETKAIHEDG
jgi:hypothetical protein